MKPVVVGISEIRFAAQPERLVTYGLGSCVAVVLFSPEQKVGAMAHVMLPMAINDRGDAPSGKYADAAVLFMVREFAQRGMAARDLVAKLTGGADMFAGRVTGLSRRIGARNVLAARKTLENHGVVILAQDVGGNEGRTAEFSTDTGYLLVRTLRGGVREI